MMLSVTSDNYQLPIGFREDGQVKWKLYRFNSDEVIVATQFNYTVASIDGDPSKRMTFTYCGPSIKPSPRTLRVFGAQFLSEMVSKLHNRREEKKFKNYV
jgi:hypothetical protein